MSTMAVVRSHGCGVQWLARDPYSYATCPGCGASGLAQKYQPSPAVIIKGRSETASWSHRGLWGQVRSAESPALAEIRSRLDAGTFRRTRDRQHALTLSRTYELARRMGMDEDARQIERHMDRANREGTGFLDRPRRQLPKGLTRTATTTRNSRGGLDRLVRIT